MINREYVPYDTLKKLNDPTYTLLLEGYAKDLGFKRAQDIMENLCKSGKCLRQRQMGWCIPDIGSYLDTVDELDRSSPLDEHPFFSKSNVIPFFHPDAPYGLFSQWCKSWFTVEGIRYRTAEQYMMSRKALLFHDYDMFEKILHEDDPAKCKKLGRAVKNFDYKKWNECCEEIVYRGNLAKFSQYQPYATFLISTGDAVLVEASPYDRIWGIGIVAYDSTGTPNPAVQDSSMWKGKNLLGNILMRVRDELRLDYQVMEVSDLGVHGGCDNTDPNNYYVSNEQRKAMEEYLKMTLHVKHWLHDEQLIHPMGEELVLSKNL